MNNDSGLSLSGSQVGTPVSSARRAGSARGAERNKVSSTSQSRQPTSISKMGTKSKIKSTAGTGQSSHRSDTGSGRNYVGRKAQPMSSAGDDFLSFFETSSKKVGPPKKPASKTAWGSVVSTDSARSGSTLVSGKGDESHRAPSGTSKFSHSVFQPSSARTNSTIDDDYTYGFAVRNGGDHSRKTEPRNIVADHHLGLEDFSLHPVEAGNSHGEELISPDLHGATSPYGNHNDMLNSSHNSSTQKATKLNSIANNMTSQALSPGLKTPFQGMENSYQNIKHKRPINQVSAAVAAGGVNLERHVAEQHTRKSNMAAVRIQRWYRRHTKRSRASEAAMRRLLAEKRQEKMQELNEEHQSDWPDGERNAQIEKRRREERARQARQEAIQELQRKREEKRVGGEGKSDQIVYLQASGKVSKSPSGKSNVSRSQKSKKIVERNKLDSSEERPSQAVSVDAAACNVDHLFQSRENSARVNSTRDAENESQLNKHDSRYNENESLHSPSQAPTKTTLDDLMATLYKLEEDERFPTARNESKPTTWIDELEKEAARTVEIREMTRPGNDIDEFLTPDRLQQLDAGKDNLRRSGFLTDEKLRSIINYLDEVETADCISDIDQELNKVNDALEKPALLVPTSEQVVQMEQASAMAAEVTSSMLTQKLELDDKKRSVSMLQKALNQQRELTVRHAKETEKEMKKRLDVQKDEYEETIKRHLSFIDQLIDDKKSLGEKCEQLVKELKTVDKKSHDKFKLLEEKHEVETRKLKEVHSAAEKLRREKWIDEKTKKIKEMTVKGLEPEIQRLIAKHKLEMKKIKSIHEAELLASDERAGQRYIRMTEELREQLANEKEAACARERELARQTYEKQMRQEEEGYQQQRRRLYSEVQEEKERVSSTASRQRQELDKLQRQLEDSHSKAAEALRQEYEKSREEQERRHQAELRQLSEQLSAEKSAWEENQLKRKEAWLSGRERELKEQVRRERDKEIELVIQRLEEDNQAAREECERVAENRIKRIRGKYEGEITELERTERQTTEKYNQTKANLAEMEGENERMKVTLRQKDKEVAELKRLLDQLNNERDRVSDVIRQEFADRLVTTDEENIRLKNDISENKARHRHEVERVKAEVEMMRQSKDEEMSQVHERVKQAIVKKEEVVQQLKEQYKSALKRADHLEGLLEQQRKQLLKK